MESNQQKKIINLIDVSGFMYRAFFALPDLMFNGQDFGAVYGYCNAILKLKSIFPNSMFIGAFDSSKHTFRHEMYNEYKSTRRETPESLISQIPYIKDASKEFGFLIVEHQGFEADDIIASYVHLLKNNDKYMINVISSDKDLMQLIDDDNNIRMFDPMKNKYISQEDVIKKFGVKSDKVLDVLSLMGDTSDNVPGIPGVGPKTASQIINDFGSLENFIKNIDSLPKTKKNDKIRDNIDLAILSKKLISLRYDVPLPEFSFEESRNQNIIEFFERCGFNTLKNRILSNSSEFIHQDRINFSSIEDIIQNNDNIKTLYIDYQNNNILEIGYIDNNGIFNIIQNIDDNKIKEFFESNINIQIISNNAKDFIKQYDYMKDVRDISVLSYCLSGMKHSHDLLSLQNEYIGKISHNNSEGIYRVYQKLISNLEGENDNIKRLYEIESKLTYVLSCMEREGILIDIEYLKNLDHIFQKHMDDLKEEIYKISGHEFNISSPKQVSYVLFDELCLPSRDKKKSTEYDNLKCISDMMDGIAGKILKWREYSKLHNTYIKSLISLADENHRVHTNYSQTSVATGRLSSSDPNLQNIPIRTEEGRKIRRGFISKNNCVFVSLDYSQMELRLLSHIANIKKMCIAFQNNEDIHKSTASLIFHESIDEVSEKQRDIAKVINFSIIYGMGVYQLSERLSIPRKEAENIYNKFFEMYPEIKNYMSDIEKFAQKHEYVETILGRRCYIKNINSKNKILQNFAIRQSINAPIQGSNSDIIKLAMIKIQEFLLKNNLKSKMILQIHDELVFEVQHDEKEIIIENVKNIMENTMKLNVPLIVDVKISNNLNE